MQIVIEISDHLYKCLQKRIELNVSSEVDQIIAKGTLLPEHHGRLIDADELKEHKYHDNHRYENAVAVAYIDWAETIIDADKESEGNG